MSGAASQTFDAPGVGPITGAVLGAGLLGLGALASAYPVAAAAVALTIFACGFVLKVEPTRLAWYAVVGVLVLSPFERWVAGLLPGGLGSVAVLMSDALVGVVLLTLPALARAARAERGRSRLLRVSDGLVAPALFVLVAIMSLLVNRPPTLDAIYFFRTYFRFIPLAVAAALLCLRNPAVLRRLLVVTVGLVAVQCGIGVIEFLGGPGVARLFWPGGVSLGAATAELTTFDSVKEQIVAGTLGHYNVLGTYATAGLCVVVGAHRLLDPTMKRRWPTALAVLFGVTVVLTLSRQSMGALAIAGMLVALLTGGRTRQLALAVVPAALIVFAAALLIAHPLARNIADRFTEITEPVYWRIAFSENRGYALATILPRAIAEDPVFGTGPGSFGRTISGMDPVGVNRLGVQLKWADYVTDVGYVAMGAQTGLLGLAAFAASLGTLGHRSWRLYRTAEWRGLGIAGLGVMMTFFITNLASSPLSYKPTSSVLWVIYGLVLAREALES